MEWLDYLRYFAEQDGSDLFLTTGAPPSAKIHGNLQPITDRPLPPGRVEDIAYTIMDEEQRTAFEHKPEMNLAVAEQGIGRFRVNIFKQRNQVSMVVRAIKTEIPHYKDLGLPNILPKLIMQKRGLILFVGGTGSGKSTSLAALIDYRNSHSAGHIITIEDPVEFVHRHKQSIVNQREVGVDTNCYEDALENTLRQAPDVILIGEIRTQEQMEQAITFAETGHLCISTLHANNANQALDRIINFFPEERHKQLFLDLSLNLRGIISQRLVPTIDNKRCAAIEILLGTPRLCDLIKQGKVDEIKEVMMKSEAQGMQTFDTALYNLYKENKISLEEALKNADSKNNLRLRINLESKSTDSVDQTILKRAQSNKAKPTPEAEKKESSSITSNLTLEPLEEEKEEEDEF
ncbi:PilT/PilU family type 4a pilus ATPase [Spartinivicinus poritis]|uniref:PilT/PilU family type 4a pilus ATPase n=1 Tax=Spartinivicinus poritis TaxID=2994640 RepID=A0ABT5U579_9GAMM|nr:PilT/PilU family type 4a pilus ATPase [Spartinivicinus sp. A2-2]MDE1460707.1 PilT/PilU family type 4a pilus ATPase [Spartinivicinus sp. A2-2]